MLDKELIIENLSLIIVIENTKDKKSHSELIKALSGFARSIENGHFDAEERKGG